MGDGLTPRERIAHVVAWERFGIAWKNMERQSHDFVLAMVDRMLEMPSQAAIRINSKLAEQFPDWEADQREMIAAELTEAAYASETL